MAFVTSPRLFFSAPISLSDKSKRVSVLFTFSISEIALLIGLIVVDPISLNMVSEIGDQVFESLKDTDLYRQCQPK